MPFNKWKFKKRWHIHAMDYYSIVKQNKLGSHDNLDNYAEWQHQGRLRGWNQCQHPVWHCTTFSWNVTIRGTQVKRTRIPWISLLFLTTVYERMIRKIKKANFLNPMLFIISQCRLQKLHELFKKCELYVCMYICIYICVCIYVYIYIVCIIIHTHAYRERSMPWLLSAFVQGSLEDQRKVEKDYGKDCLDLRGQ